MSFINTDLNDWIKGDAKKCYNNCEQFRGYKCTLYGIVKLITEFLAFQKAIQIISIGFEYSTLHYDEGFLTKMRILQKFILHQN